MTTTPEIWELNGDYYQVIGHAWDHEVKDFKVVYRPLYHCTAKPDRFEAHYMAVSHFSRWEEKFRKVPDEEMDKIPKEVQEKILPGPFWKDDAWTLSAGTVKTSIGLKDEKTKNISGLGTRSHE